MDSLCYMRPFHSNKCLPQTVNQRMQKKRAKKMAKKKRDKRKVPLPSILVPRRLEPSLWLHVIALDQEGPSVGVSKGETRVLEARL